MTTSVPTKALWTADADVLAGAYPPDPSSDWAFDHSRADFALLLRLAKLTGCNPVRMDSLFRESELYRDKWERSDYRVPSVERAIARVRERHDPSVVFGGPKVLPDGVSPILPTPAPRAEEYAAHMDPFEFASRVAGRLESQPRFHFQKFADITVSRESRSLIEDVIDCEALATIIGKAGQSKTFVAVDMALAIARGVPWFGHGVRKRGFVVYVAAEGGGAIRKRIEAYRRRHRLERSDLDFYLLAAPIDLLDRNGAIQQLVGAIKQLELERGCGCAAVFVDTLSVCIAGSDENGPEAMTSAVASAQELIGALGCTVVLIHHLGKDAARGARGHSSLFGAVDTELTVEATGSDFVLKATKQRDIEQGREHFYGLESVSLGQDGAGREMTSCVVVPRSAPVRSEGRPISQTAQRVYECFEHLLESAWELVPEDVIEEKYGSANTRFRQSVRGVRQTVVQERFVRSEQDDPNSRDTQEDSSKRSFRRGISKLKVAELIEGFGGYVWKFERT